MKIIIDIDERAYNGCLKLKSNDDMGVLGFHLINATANGTPLEDIRTDIHSHKMDFYPSDYTLINTLIDKWINKGVNV